MKEKVNCEAVAQHSKSTANLNQNPVRYGDKAAVAAMLGLSRRSVDNLLAEGAPHLKLGSRCVRFDMEEVRVWLKEQFGQQRRRRVKSVYTEGLVATGEQAQSELKETQSQNGGSYGNN